MATVGDASSAKILPIKREATRAVRKRDRETMPQSNNPIISPKLQT
jgi:hypothetical protein